MVWLKEARGVNSLTSSGLQLVHTILILEPAYAEHGVHGHHHWSKARVFKA